MSADSESALDIPDGLPGSVTISEFAAATNLKARTVRSWVDGGTIKTLPTGRNQKRLIPIEELDRFRAEGWPVDWERLL